LALGADLRHHSLISILKDSMYIKLGQIHIHKPPGLTRNDPAYEAYDTMFWDVELIDAPDCWDELQRTDIWQAAPSAQGVKRHSCYTGHHDSELLNRIGALPSAHQEQFIRAAEQGDTSTTYSHLRQLWSNKAEYYIQHCHTHSIIYHDEPGFEMNIHLDNGHIMLQLIINLTDNDSGTELYDITSTEPYYTVTGEKNKGIMFLNGPGALHRIRNINKDRYILYSAVMYGGDK
jgi:hypothetical protein